MAVCIRPGATRHFPPFSENSRDGKPSPGSEFPGLEPQQLSSCWTYPSFPGRKAQWGRRRHGNGSCRCDRGWRAWLKEPDFMENNIPALEEGCVPEPPTSCSPDRGQQRFSPPCLECPPGLARTACLGLNPSSTTYQAVSLCASTSLFGGKQR